MKWYHYVMCFFGGVFVANFIPHFVEGITGNAFPTPFNFLVGQPAPPVGKSPPQLNVVWGLANLVVGYLLLRYGNFSLRGSWATVIVALAGFAVFSIFIGGMFAAVPR